MALRKTEKIRRGPYQIKRSFPEPLPLELHPKIFKASHIFTFTSWIVYIVFQFLFAWSVQTNTARPKLLWRMWIFLWAEVALSFQQVVGVINIILSLYAADESRRRPSYRLIGSSAPTVDVFITCCGEPTDIVVDTVAAAAALDYPPQQFRVLVLDDGHDEMLHEAIKILVKKSTENAGPQIKYLSRNLAPGVKSYFKAGNLQFGIEETRLWGGGSEYLASLDADMIPKPGWLRMMVPHLILEDALAMACPAPVIEFCVFSYKGYS